MRPDNENGRPWQGGPVSSTAINDEHDDTAPVRCVRCSAPLTAPRSVARGLGPICCKAAS